MMCCFQRLKIDHVVKGWGEGAFRIDEGYRPHASDSRIIDAIKT